MEMACTHLNTKADGASIITSWPSNRQFTLTNGRNRSYEFNYSVVHPTVTLQISESTPLAYEYTCVPVYVSYGIEVQDATRTRGGGLRYLEGHCIPYLVPSPRHFPWRPSREKDYQAPPANLARGFPSCHFEQKTDSTLVSLKTISIEPKSTHPPYSYGHEAKALISINSALRGKKKDTTNMDKT